MLKDKESISQNLLEGQEQSTPVRSPLKDRSSPTAARLALSGIQRAVISEVEQQVEKQQREIAIEPTKYNKVKLFIVNVYEPLLLSLCLALSIYSEDAATVIFQIVMQVVMFYSLKNMGKYSQFKLKITLGTLIAIIALAVYKIYVISSHQERFKDIYETSKDFFKTLGIQYEYGEANQAIGFNPARSFTFEILGLILTLLLVRYYKGTIKRQQSGQPFGFTYHSLFLKQYMTLYTLLFAGIALDTFFSQTLIQLLMLAAMYGILFLWAFESTNKNAFINFVVTNSQRFYSVQLALYAIMQTPLSNVVVSTPTLYNFFYYAGFITLENYPFTVFINSLTLQFVIHIFLICFILGLNALYKNTYNNFLYYERHKTEYEKTSHLKQLLDHVLETEPQDNEIEKKKGGFKSKLQSFNFSKFFEKYMPYVCIWVSRIISIAIAYFYHGIPAFVVLTWILFSFAVMLVKFVDLTVKIYMPAMTFFFFFGYIANIPGLFFKGETIYNPGVFDFTRKYQFPPIEIAFQALNVMVLVTLIKTRATLKIQRDEFKLSIFRKLTDFKSLFLWQISFYILKRLHTIILTCIFIFGMEELNLYYIGLMFYFISYTSSLATYRKSGKTLIYYAGFFIWINYLWSLIQPLVPKDSFITNIFMMLTFSKYSEEKQQDTSYLNQYMQYKIPYAQWVILLLNVMMSAINDFFRTDKVVLQKSFEDETKMTTYGSTAIYYEAKADYVLRRKFPNSAKVLVRLQMLFSEMMILIILIVQGAIVAGQTPNIIFWGFLIFSFTLQTAVVSATEHTKLHLKRCENQSKILRIYSTIATILQIVYYFLNHPSFLAQYGWGNLLATYLGSVNDYMEIIGFYQMGSKENQLMKIFFSQVLFQVTATILEDYFKEQIQQIDEAEKQDLQTMSFQDRSKSQVRLNEEQEDEQPHPTVGLSVVAQLKMKAQKSVSNLRQEDDFDHETEAIKFNYERIRFSVPYMIYQRINQWSILDSITTNFHLVTATVTIILCTNWQISLFMSFYLFCTVVLCIRAAMELHNNGLAKRQLDKEIDVNKAHILNKQYMQQANDILLRVRTNQWWYQYWLLIISMVVMYPTPILQELKENQLSSYIEEINKLIFWLFWSGIYVPLETAQKPSSHVPLYGMLTLLILEKLSQRWMNNRYGCSIEKIREFKTLEEQLRLINDKQNTRTYPFLLENEPSLPIQQVNVTRSYVTMMEAKQECARIQLMYREQTTDCKEKQLREQIENGIKRKYIIQFRSAMKIVVEQLSLLLLLLSCANKSNIISIIYLGLLVMFLFMKNKTTAMLYMSYSFGLVLAVEYTSTLFNLTSVNSPMEFPSVYKVFPALVDGKATSPYAIPLFLSNEFLRNNLNWAIFFGMDLERSQVNDIWFDFANLVVLTIYFFNFGNPINAQNLKVSLSRTVQIEESLQKYSKIQMKKKVLKLQGGDTNNIGWGKKRDDSFNSETAADPNNSLEHQLGSTFYLNDLKSRIFIYNFVKNMKYVTFIGAQLITLIVIFTMALLCRSLMSIGYLVMCVPLIWSITDFFNLEKLHQANERWKHPYYICGPLLIFSFIDIGLQIMFQIPFVGGSTFQFERLFGFDKIYKVDADVTFEQLLAGNAYLTSINTTNLFFLVFKSINLFHIFLQARIYESAGFWKFVRVDMRNLQSMAKNFKRLAMAFKLNNWKLQKIVTIQQNKKKMYNGVNDVKNKVQQWQQMIARGAFGSSSTQKQAAKVNLKQSLLTVQEEEESHQDNEQTSQSIASQIGSLISPTSQLRDKSKSIVELLTSGKKMSSIKDYFEQDKHFLRKKKIFKDMKKKLGRCGRLYLWFTKKKVDQVVFINQIDECHYVKNQLELGKTNIYCDLEKVMVRDINLEFEIRHTRKQEELKQYQSQTSSKRLTFEEKKNKKKNEEYHLSQLPKTTEFLATGHIIQANIGAFFRAIFSCQATLAYTMMVLSMILNAGFLTIFYPLGVFGYALMEEGRPGKWFWKIMLNYTLVILFLKFFVQLDFLQQNQDLVDTYVAIDNWVISGLRSKEGISALFLYMLPEITVLSLILGQIYYEHLNGLYEKREIFIEDITQAKQRFLTAIKEAEAQKENNQRTTFIEQENKLEEIDDLNEDGETYVQRISQFKFDLQVNKQEQLLEDQGTRKDDWEVYEGLKTPFEEDKVEVRERRNSFYDDQNQLHQAAKSIKKERLKGKDPGLVKKFFGKKNYFQRLFPSIKEQKPGIDLYASITFTQFLICFYLIKYYTKMDAYGTQNLENTSQFSINMVVMLFIQIFVMILERYISRTNTRVIKKGSKLKSNIVEQEDTSMNKTMSINAPKPTMSLRGAKTSETQLGQAVAQAEKDGQEIEIDLVATRMTAQQVIKYISLVALILIYHILIFWIFPLVSNFAIYGEPICDTTSTNYDTFGCFNFHSNIYLIIFYLIFCRYFMLSALQIKHGLPDFRRGSSLTAKYDLSHALGYRIFYVLPFLLELKTILDWCFTNTSLDIFQWLELAQIYSEMFFYKCGNQGYFTRPWGKKIEKFEKYLCGCFCLGTILFFLAGPFLMFSNLSVIAQANLVTDASIDFSIKVFDKVSLNTYNFPIFSQANPLNMDVMSEEEFSNKSYHKNPETKFFESSQVQVVRMKNSSDEAWMLSDSNQKIFETLLKNASKHDENIEVTLKFYYKFTRPGPEAAKKTAGNEYKVLNYSSQTDLKTIKQFQNILSVSSETCGMNPDMKVSFTIYDYIPYMIRLTEQDVAKVMQPKGLHNKGDVELTYSCRGYWSLNVNGAGVQFETFSDLISTGFFGATSIMGFYFAVAYLVGSSLRKIAVYNSDRIFTCDMPNTEAVINLCDCIYMQRLEGNLKREEELFFVLMEAMRSPELLKAIGGISLQERPQE